MDIRVIEAEVTAQGLRSPGRFNLGNLCPQVRQHGRAYIADDEGAEADNTQPG